MHTKKPAEHDNMSYRLFKQPYLNGLRHAIYSSKQVRQEILQQHWAMLLHKDKKPKTKERSRFSYGFGLYKDLAPSGT